MRRRSRRARGLACAGVLFEATDRSGGVGEFAVGEVSEK
jgi:hypothetical protein